jgi:hypothetical protein
MSQDPNTVTLRNVRLSFPALFEPKKGPEETSKSAYAATFLLDKELNATDIKAVQAAISALVKAEFKGVTPPKVCLRDGNEKNHLDGYGPDVMFISARNEKRQLVLDRDAKTPVVASDNKIYAGCYVNAVIRLWAQNNKFGKRINASLGPVQFVRDGEEFGDSKINPADHFQPVSDDAVV